MKRCRTCKKVIRRKKYKRDDRPQGWRWEPLVSFRKRVYCSLNCYYKSLEGMVGESHFSYKKRIKKNCRECGKEFYILPSRSHRTYCSVKCSNLFRKGKKRPGIGLKGKNNPAWKGGITKTGQLLRTQPEYQRWRGKVLERDKYACWICSKRKSLVVHHLESFSKYPYLRLKVKNGLILCRFCHKTYAHQKM